MQQVPRRPRPWLLSPHFSQFSGRAQAPASRNPSAGDDDRGVFVRPIMAALNSLGTEPTSRAGQRARAVRAAVTGETEAPASAGWFPRGDSRWQTGSLSADVSSARLSVTALCRSQTAEWLHDPLQQEEGEVPEGRLLLEEEERWEDDPRGPHEAQGPGRGGKERGPPGLGLPSGAEGGLAQAARRAPLWRALLFVPFLLPSSPAVPRPRFPCSRV